MLRWTKHEPVEEGWYWLKRIYPKETTVEIVYIRWYVGKLCIMNWPIPKNGPGHNRNIEWAGPIPSPKDPIRRRRGSHGKRKNKT